MALGWAGRSCQETTLGSYRPWIEWGFGTVRSRGVSGLGGTSSDPRGPGVGDCEVPGGGGRLLGFVLGGDPTGPTDLGRGPWGELARG